MEQSSSHHSKRVEGPKTDNVKTLQKAESQKISYEDQELQEFLSKKFGITYQQLEREVSITNGFGFIKDTIDLNAGLDPTQITEEENMEPSTTKNTQSG